MKNRLIIIIIAVLSGFILNSAIAQTDDYRQINDNLEIEEVMKSISSSTNTIKSDFIQEKLLSFLTEPITSKGKFIFKRDNSLRWEYTTPYEYLIIFHNENIWIKDGDKISSFDTQSNAMFKEINDMMIGMINGEILSQSDQFEISYYKNTGSYLIKLKPLQEEMKKMILSINIKIDKSDSSVSEIEIKETEADFTSIKFLNRKLNEEIPDHIFDINR